MSQPILPKNEAPKHTPGPWKVWRDSGSTWIAPSDPNADVIADALDIYDDETNDANANLLAAAPQMLTALKAAAHALRSFQYGNTSPELAKEIADTCEKAMSTARGEV